MYWLLNKILILTVYASNHDRGGGNDFTNGSEGGNDFTNSGGISISNPLGEGATIETLIVNIIDFLVLIAIPILTLVILYAAFLMFTAGGKEEQFKQGKTALLYALIGFAILLASEGIARLIEAVITGQDISS